jgi:hypothetical protein
LIPVHAKIWSEEDVRRQGIDRLFSQLKTSGSRVRLVVIEASPRNPYERRFKTCSHGLAPIQASENALILSSAAPGRVVEYPTEQHSQLMSALLTQMDSSNGIEEDNTRIAVAAATRGQQIPAVSSTLTESVSLWSARSGTSVSSVGSAARSPRVIKQISADLKRSRLTCHGGRHWSSPPCLEPPTSPGAVPYR